MTDPVTAHPSITPPEQEQEEPGLDRDLIPQADHGEKSYRGRDRLTGKRALITGADSGIGAAIAIAFAREGATVTLAYLPSEEPDADEVADLLDDAGIGVHRLPGDLQDADYRESLVSAAAEEMGGLDVLVNNAGRQIAVGDIAELSDEEIQATFETNILAMFTLCRNAVQIMEPGSAIINTTSIQAYQPSPQLLDYASTKAAINNFTKGLAAQVAPKGIRVNAVAPGPIWTPLQPSHGQLPEKLPEFGKKTWLGRAGQPAELAPAYVFLATDEASYVVGTTVHVNGGEPTP